MSAIDDAEAQFESDVAIAHQIIHGDANTTVQTEGGPVKSFAKVVADNAQDLSGKQDASGKNAASGYPGLSSTFGLELLNAGGSVVSQLTSLATAARTVTLPDRDITVAGLDDLVGKVDKITLGATPDLNTILTPGVYTFTGASVNGPAGAVGQSATLIVGNTNGSTGICHQILISRLGNLSFRGSGVAVTGNFGAVAWTTAAIATLTEQIANKVTALAGATDLNYPSALAVKTYVDASVAGLLDDRGSWDASGNLFPSTNGSGASGAIMKGDTYFISVAGQLNSKPVSVGATVRALADAPGQTAASWDILNSNIGYVAENAANKDATGGYAGLTAFKLNIWNAAGTIKSLITSLATAARNYTLPDKDGTFAMLSDLNAGYTTLTGMPYDFTTTAFGKPAAGATVARSVAARSFTIPAALAGSKVSAGVAATAAAAFTVNKISGGTTTAIGTISIAAGATTATFTAAAAVSFAAGDVLTIVAPGTADSTLADIAITVFATLN